MKNINFTTLSIQSAKNFRSMISTNNVYLYIGKSTAWDNEADPDQPVNMVEDAISARESMVYLHKLALADTTLAIPTKLWVSGTVYDQYESDSDISETDFYVSTTTNKVYKCLDNASGAASTVTPSGSSVNSFITADGYTWKFMYDISATMLLKFTNVDYIPVPTSTQMTSSHQNVETAATYTAGDPEGGHGKNASRELFAKYAIVSADLDLSAFSPDITHRQFGILVNPLLDNGTSASASSYLISSSTIDEYSGDLLTLTNHVVVNTATEDSEQVQLIVRF